MFRDVVGGGGGQLALIHGMPVAFPFRATTDVRAMLMTDELTTPPGHAFMDSSTANITGQNSRK